MHTFPDRYVQVDRFRVRYWDEGQGEPVVLIHGFGGFVEIWETVFPKLTGYYRVIAPDLLGYGKTDKPLDESYGVENMARFMCGFIEALNLERAHVVGHSFGGGVALVLSILFPEVVDKLVLVDCGGLGPEVDLPSRLLTLPVVGELLSRCGLDDFRTFLSRSTVNSQIITDDVVELFYEMSRMPGAQATLLKTARDNGTFWGQKREVYQPILEHLHDIQQDTLVIWGRDDQTLPVRHADVARAEIPHAQVEILDGCGHNPMIDDEGAFMRLLLQFLDGRHPAD